MTETGSKQVSKVEQFWNAFQACVEENRVGPDRSVFYVRWAQEFVRFEPGKRLRDRTRQDVEAFLADLRERPGVSDWRARQAEHALKILYEIFIPGYAPKRTTTPAQGSEKEIPTEETGPTTSGFRDRVIPGEVERLFSPLLDAARLAPSGSNAQPWRFKIVRDQDTKLKLVQASHRQSFIADAPVVLVCCVDIEGFLNGTVSGIQDLGKIGAIEGRIVKILMDRSGQFKTMDMEQLIPRITFNLAIAVEHIALRALDFGLGTCWIRLLDEAAIKGIFGWSDHISVVALLTIGYPDESPAPRKRLKIEEILID